MHRRSFAWLLLLAACADYERPPRACDAVGLLCVQEDVVYELGLAGSNSASGDLDGDGSRELVTASAGGLSITWGLTQQREYRLFAGGVPDVALGDVDSDGDLDVVFLTAEPPTLRVLENRGTRALAEGPTVALTGHLNSLWIGELDGDGELDALVAASENGRISVITGGLKVIEDIVVGRDLAAVAAGDMNGDGALDLVAVDRADAGIYLALASGSGFTASQRIATGVRPEYLQLYDHDGDGKLDVLTHGTGREIWFHPGDGAGGLGEARGLVVQTGASAGFLAHRDEQGQRWLVTIDAPDVTASRLDDDDRVVARVLAGGSFERLDVDEGAPLVSAGWYATRFSLAPSHVFTEVARDASFDERPLALADVDLDGELDLVSMRGDVAVRRGLADGTWGAPSMLVMAHPVASLVVADVTGDGLPDLVIGDEAPSLIVAVGAGDGTFIAGPPAPLEHEPVTLYATADAPAAVLTGSFEPAGATALRFDAAGVVTEQSQPLADWNGGALASADIDGDGDDDLIALDATPALVIVPRQGDGWGPPTSRSLADVDAELPAPYLLRSAYLVVGDLDLDERFDAVLVTSAAIVRLFDIAAAAPPAPRIDRLDARGEPALVDIDGDDRLDLVACAHGDAVIVLFASDGELQPQTPLSTQSKDCVLHVDREGGRATAAFVGDRGLSLLRPDLAPALGQPQTFLGGPGPLRRLAVGDIDADGHTDVVVGADVNVFSGSTAILWGDANGSPRAADWQFNNRYGAAAEIAVAQLDDRPGDDIVLAWSDGNTEILTSSEGALERRSVTKSPPFWPGSFGSVGVQARVDGRSDVIVLGFTSEEELGLVALPRGDDGGLLEDASVVLWSEPYHDGLWPMTIADFDGDGYDDIAVLPGTVSSGSATLVWGDRARSPDVTSVPLSFPMMKRLSTADLDGDGTPELIADGENGAISFTFTGHEPTGKIVLQRHVDGLLAADLQNDGRPDLLRVDGDELDVIVRTSGGESSMRIDFAPPWSVLQAADLDGDGLLDLVGLRDGAVVTRLSADP